MSRNKGTFKFPSNYEVQISAPLDPRITVSDKSELISENTWPSDNGTLYVYKGLLVSVQNEKSVYMLIDKDKILDEDFSGWRRIDVSIDNSLLENSENPVQNKVIKEALDNKANKSDLSGYLKEIQDGSITKNKLTTDLYKELIKVYHPDDLGFWMNQPENSDIDYAYGSRTIAINYDLDNRKATLQAGETAYDVTSNIVNNAVVYKWIPIISLYDNAGLKEIVSGSFLCEEGKQGFGFIYDNKQYSVCINETEDGVSYEETINELGGTQSADVPEYSISKADKDDGTEYQLTKDGKPITGSESIFISKSTGTGDCDLESLELEEDIIIKDGPLSKILNDADINIFEKGMNLQDLLLTLFQREIWPSPITTQGTISGVKLENGVISVNITTDTSGPVLPGAKIKFTASGGSIPNCNKKNSSVAGFTYGYSDTLEGNKQTGIIQKSWSLTQTSKKYSISITNTDNNKTVNSSNNESIVSIDVIAKVGDNKCSASASGTATYSADIDAIPEYYVFSSLGNRSEKHKSDSTTSVSTQITCEGGGSAEKTVTCVYPCYHNGKDLGEVVQEGLTNSDTFNIHNIPSEKEKQKKFIFEYPADHEITSFKKNFMYNTYTCYTNIVNNSLVDIDPNADFTKIDNIGKTTFNGLSKIDVPSENTFKKHFVVYFVSGLDIPTIQVKYPDGFKLLNENTYKITPNAKIIGNTSYDKFETTGNWFGDFTYSFTFSSKGPKDDDGYTTEDFDKIINGYKYKYKRLTTNGTADAVSRQIVFNKKMGIT